MDATNGRHWKRRHRRRHRRDPPAAPEPPPRSDSVSEVPANSIATATYESVSTHESDFVENKMGLPPPYEQSSPNPAPPPSYFGDHPPPPPGLVVPAPPRTTVITTPPGAGAGSAPSGLGPGPTGTTCASCNRSIVTRVDYVPNNRTHIVSAALCVLAGCCCGCIIPYCMRSCKTANHYCPKCRAFVGTYTPS